MPWSTPSSGGVGLHFHPERLLADGRTGELAAWNSGNVAVLAGTFLGSPLLVDAGGLALVVALGLFLRGVRGSRVKGRWPLVLYRLLAGVVAVSIPVGLALSALRHG